MPISPSAASFESSSRGNCCASSHSRVCGRISGFGELGRCAAAAPDRCEIRSSSARLDRIIRIMRLRRLLPLIGLVLAVSSRPAFADATLFLGAISDTDQSRR